MVKRDLASEFSTLRDLLVGVRRGDDHGPILTIEDILLVSESADVIEGRILYADDRAPGHPTRTSDFDYEAEQLAVDGPEAAADLLLVNLEEDVLAAD
ncbi:hypothetical protein [Aeromicrobium duanguangcaii]|uniref:Uncharacterized protein n=1 Tax=Aeromicrobium duanguangcaii TaxID=2968086 RepID=A0ABY5KJ47_9ACTN|nr:hypothetical protein [Aeromicrobium duanguangcaii]MCD9153750.1 hypothetical protein [Aeromicrobium duanguangcaii]UUI69172.1 hypothetical protein NP095_03430 [Aeromicrobium duanguangcaii]